MKLDVLIADPAGNITAFVFGEVPADRRKAAAALLMAKKELKIEQIGFCSKSDISDGRLEMAGGEFCGNASRAYALALCVERNLERAELTLEVSGCRNLIKARVNAPESFAEAEMPLPQYVGVREVEGKLSTLVHLGGIAHLIVPDADPDTELFARAERVFDEFPSLEAYGVMFLDRKQGRLTPAVRVRAINSLFWEGSCASGTVACAIAESTMLKNGIFTRTYLQPCGSLTASVRREDGKAAYTSIGGSVRLQKWISFDI